MGTTANRWIVVIAVIWAALGSQSAFARDRWTQPYSGVRHLHRTGQRLDAHVVLVDLGAAELSIVATKPEDRSLSVREFGRRYSADIAINANYFNGGARSCGLAVGDGEVWNDSYRDGCEMSIGFGALNQALPFDSTGRLSGPLPRRWMEDVVTGKPWLVRNGVIQSGWAEPRHIHGSHPRTAIALTRDRKTLILAVVDGRRSTARGMRGTELAELLVEFDAHDALNLDGGGSSELWIRSERGVQNRPSDGRPRPVGNHLGIRFHSGVKWWDSETVSGTGVGTRGGPSIEEGTHASFEVPIRNTGRAPWPAGDVRFVLETDDAAEVLGSSTFTLARAIEPGQTTTLRWNIAGRVPGNHRVRIIPVFSEEESESVAALRWPLRISPSQSRNVTAQAKTDVAQTERPSIATASIAPSRYVSTVPFVAASSPNQSQHRLPREIAASVSPSTAGKGSLLLQWISLSGVAVCGLAFVRLLKGKKRLM